MGERVRAEQSRNEDGFWQPEPERWQRPSGERYDDGERDSKGEDEEEEEGEERRRRRQRRQRGSRQRERRAEEEAKILAGRKHKKRGKTPRVFFPDAASLQKPREQ